MIQLKSITRKYGDFAAVNDISFEITKGEIVGLLGHNGAGKTTILKMLTGFLEPSDGFITIDGLDMEKQRGEIQQRIGYLPENCPLYPEMSVIEHLDYAATLHNIVEDEKTTRIRTAIMRTELIAKATAPISTLSRGYRQRVGVAQAILHTPKIIVLDEPTNGLDPSQIFQMRSLIKELAKDSTVIISTHILQEVQAICDRVIIIRNGKKYLDAQLEDLRKANRLLVEINAGPEQAEPIFNGLSDITGCNVVSGEDGHHRYTLAVKENGHVINTAPMVAETVVTNGWRLFQLSQERRDLETIFGEISAQEKGAAQ
jgi:ABC-2 type transport system ATP-binding protein